MQDEKLLKLFERFRRDGDVGALGEVFDLAGSTLMNVARHLSRDTAEAEDLVQATFLTAIEKARSFDANRPLLPWLLGILTLHARDSRRKRDRSPDPDRLQRSDEVGPLDQAATTELAAAVERALATLPELYRDVLGAHLSQGLKPEQIARRIHVAPGTVRVRLHRGLKRLRKALPAGYATGAAVALTAGRGQAAVKAAVLEGGRAAVAGWAGQGLVASASSSATFGASWASKALLPFLSLLVAGGVGWLAWVGLRPDRPPAAVDSAARPPIAEGPGTDAPVIEPLSEPATRTLEPVASSAHLEPGWWLVGNLGGWNASVGGLVQVTVRDVTGVAVESVAADPRGHWAVSLDELFASLVGAPEELLVQADHPAFVPAGRFLPLPDRPPLGPTERAELRADVMLERTFGRVVGRVFLPAVDDPTRIDVALLPLDGQRGRFAETVVASCNAAGRFDLRAPGPGEYAVVTAWPGRRPDWARVRLAGTDVDVEVDLAPPAGRELRGHAVLASGPAPDGIVRAHPVEPRFVGRIHLRQATVGWTLDGPELTFQEGRIGRDGVFRIEGLPDGECELVFDGQRHLRELGCDQGAQEQRVFKLAATAPDLGLDLRFEQWAAVLEVRSDGVLVPEARVEFLDGDWRRFPSGRETAPDLLYRGDRTDALGRYGLVAGLAERRLLITKEGYEPQELRWRPELESVDGRIVVDLEAGPPAAQLGLVLPNATEHVDLYRVRSLPVERLEAGQRSPHDEGETLSRILAARDGTLLLNDLLPGRWNLQVRPTLAHATRWYGNYACPTTVDVDLRPGEIKRVDLPVIQGGRISLSIDGYTGTRAKVVARLARDGRAVDVQFFAIDPVTAEGRTTAQPFVERVNFTQPNLPPGHYELEVGAGRGWTPVRRTIELVAGETARVRVELHSAGASAD